MRTLAIGISFLWSNVSRRPSHRRGTSAALWSLRVERMGSVESMSRELERKVHPSRELILSDDVH